MSGTTGGAGSVHWDGATYAVGAAHHRAYDDYVLAPLRIRPGMRVLDVGCGSGELTAHIAAVVSADAATGEVVGVEPDPSQLQAARRHATSGLTLVEGRAQDIAQLVQGPFDVVLSVAVLQWVPFADHARILRSMSSLLRPGGALRLDLGGSGQIAAVREVLDPVAARYGGLAPWTFPTVEDYVPLLDEADVDTGSAGWVRLTRQLRAFPDAPSFLTWLRSQIIIGYVRDMELSQAEAFSREAQAVCLDRLRRSDGSFDQEYVRLDVLAWRRSA